MSKESNLALIAVRYEVDTAKLASEVKEKFSKKKNKPVAEKRKE